MESLKDKAKNFLQLIIAGQIDKAYETYVNPELRHHNAYFEGDMESLKNAMQESENTNPNKLFDMKLAIEEGDQVMVYSHIRQTPNDLGYAVAHIFRFEEGKIIEMWDIGQAVPEDSPNKNGMF